MKDEGLLRRLMVVAMILVIGVAGICADPVTKPREEYDMMLDAAERAEAAFEAICMERANRGLTIDPENDVNGTGLIGERFTAITTTVGNIEAKRTSTNPNGAALVVKLLWEAGVRSGDRIAVNCSGSFPAMNIAVLCAMDAMKLEGAVFCSVGASTYGANAEEFTYPDMELFLYENGYITRKSQAFSLGGENDQGLEFPTEIKERILKRLSGFGYEYWEEEELETNIRKRMERYGNVSCFVNVGGNLVSSGGSDAYSGKSGVLREMVSNSGLVGKYLERGIPVVHLLNIKKLFSQNGLPIDPIPLPKSGEGEVYYESAAPAAIAWLLLLAGALGVLWAVKGRVKRQPL